MYDELVKRLRICPDYNEGCLNCPHEHDLGCRSSTMREAADAIEKLRTSSDVQPVVRCIKCKYYEGLARCKLIGDCGGTNWFCGWGEPKEET